MKGIFQSVKGIFQSILKGFSEVTSQPHKEGFEHSCAECRNLTCHSIHGSVVPECPLKGCYACADLARIDDDISTTYERLSNLVQERQQMMTKARHDPIIHRLPVEILSSIFVSVKDATFDFDFEEYPDLVVPKPRYRQPSQSPPLLVGAVCKRWREITLTTPRLWTDIIVNLSKCADGQAKMVRNWARRAGVLPLDITIFISSEDLALIAEPDLLEEVVDILLAVREVAVRWNDIATHIPDSVCYRLLNNLQETPAIRTLFLDDVYGPLDKIRLRNSLRRRRLISDCISSTNIPFEWDRLVFVNISDADDRDIFHIIRHAHNLRHCIALVDEPWVNFENLFPTSPITNRSLIHLDVNCNIIGHLNLPSLQYLDYFLDSAILDESFDTVVEFIKRSCPPLDKFILRLDVLPEEQVEDDAFPSFEKLPGITSLFIDEIDTTNSPWMNHFFQALTRPSPPTILPHLEELTGSSFHFSGPSWKSFSRLFWKGSNPAESEPASDTSIAIRRPLSKVDISVYDPSLSLDRETFLQLLEVKKSGVDLNIKIHGKGDLFEYMAPIHGVEL